VGDRTGIKREPKPMVEVVNKLRATAVRVKITEPAKINEP
jgi:hypothetical protein